MSADAGGFGFYFLKGGRFRDSVNQSGTRVAVLRQSVCSRIDLRYWDRPRLRPAFIRWHGDLGRSFNDSSDAIANHETCAQRARAPRDRTLPYLFVPIERLRDCLLDGFILIHDRVLNDIHRV